MSFTWSERVSAVGDDLLEVVEEEAVEPKGYLYDSHVGGQLPEHSVEEVSYNHPLKSVWNGLDRNVKRVRPLVASKDCHELLRKLEKCVSEKLESGEVSEEFAEAAYFIIGCLGLGLPVSFDNGQFGQLTERGEA